MVLRIIGGKYKGHHISRPPTNITRPTMDRVREAIFNMLTHGEWSAETGNPIENAVVLDAFAGSGALGLEALSRGAEFVYFFDKNSQALTVVRANIDKLKEQDHTKLMKVDATSPPKAHRPATLILLDPPFGKDLVSRVLPPLEKAGWFAPQALIVAEIEAHEEVTFPPHLELLKHRFYGTAQVFLWQTP